MAEPIFTGDLATGIAGVATALVGTLLWLRRRVSKDSTEINADKAQNTILGTALSRADAAERDAREAWAQRTKDAEAIARLSVQNEALIAQISLLRDEKFVVGIQLKRLKMELGRQNPELRRFLGSDFGPINDEGKPNG